MPSHWEAFPSVVPSCLAGFNLVFCGKFYLKTVMKRTINAPKSEIWARMKRMQDANKLWILKEKLQRKNEIKQVWLHHNKPWFSSVQFISVTQLCPTLCDPMDYSMPGFLVHHQLPELTQTDDCGVGDAIQPFHPLLSPSPPSFSLSQHQGLFQWVSSSRQVARVLEFPPQHQSFQWTLRTDLL